MAKNKLILLRHGQSQWNKNNLFTGWVDVPLSTQGIEEALKSGQLIKNYPIDIIYTSTLIRAQMTALLAMSVHESGKVPVIQHKNGKHPEYSKIYSQTTEAETIPVICAWELNERMYGELQGLNKAEIKAQVGEEQLQIWRRSYDIPPPKAESLKMTAQRTLPFFDNVIFPQLKQGKNILISAHGNSLRSIIMELDQLSETEVVSLEIPFGIPIIYEYENDQLKKHAL